MVITMWYYLNWLRWECLRRYTIHLSVKKHTALEVLENKQEKWLHNRGLFPRTIMYLMYLHLHINAQHKNHLQYKLKEYTSNLLACFVLSLS